MVKKHTYGSYFIKYHSKTPAAIKQEKKCKIYL